MFGTIIQEKGPETGEITDLREEASTITLNRCNEPVKLLQTWFAFVWRLLLSAHCPKSLILTVGSS